MRSLTDPFVPNPAERGCPLLDAEFYCGGH
jgi:hypothetical protein